MAELIYAGGWSANRHPVTGDPDHPDAHFTPAWVHTLIGTPDVVRTVVTDPDSGRRLGYLFFQPEARAYTAGKRPNFNASALVGRLLYGTALYCVHGVDLIAAG